jgi:hypothetical protein
MAIAMRHPEDIHGQLNPSKSIGGTNEYGLAGLLTTEVGVRGVI